MSRARHKAVIFDLFGTLIEVWSWAEFHEMMAGMATTLGAPVDEFSRRWSRQTRSEW